MNFITSKISTSIEKNQVFISSPHPPPSYSFFFNSGPHGGALIINLKLEGTFYNIGFKKNFL